MPATTSFFVDPYFDDYNSSKNFFRVLYRPGVSVQARELTQVQSILQNQIEEHGRITVKNGEAITGGEIVLDKSLTALTIGDISNTATPDITPGISTLVGKIITNGTVRARVVSTTTNTLLVSYIGSGEFTTELFTQEDDSLISATISNISQAINATIAAGVFFIHGFYISTSEQTLIISQTTNTPLSEIIVGYNVSETIITSDADTSLLDPAQGSFNENAPGANRFSISLTLSSITTDSSLLPHDRNSNQNFVELFRVGTDGDRVIDNTENVVSKVASQAIYDTTENYVLEDFSADISGNTDSIMLNVSQGKAILNGRVVEKLDKDILAVANTKLVTGSTINQKISQKFGNYLKGSIQNLSAAFTLEESQDFEIHSISSGTRNTTSSTLIATCNIRELKSTSSNSIDVHLSNLLSADALTSNLTSLTRISNPLLNQINVVLDTTVFSAVSGAYNFATLKLIDGVSNSEPEIFEVTTHTSTTGSNHTFTLDRLPSKSSYSSIEIHFNIRMAKSIFGASNDIVISDDGINSEGTVLFESSSNSLYYEIPNNGTESVSDVEFILRKLSTEIVSGGTVTLTADTGSLFPFSDGTLSLEQIQQNFFLYSTSDDTFLDFSSNTLSIEIENSSSTARITGIPGVGVTFTNIHYNLKFSTTTSSSRRSKSLVAGNRITYTESPLEQGHFEIAAGSTNKVQGLGDTLTGFFDIQNLVAVLEVPAADNFTSSIILSALANPTTSSINVTDRYTLDNGQRDDRYEQGRIILKGNATSPTGKLLVIVDSFSHADPSKAYFTKSSYLGTTEEQFPDYISEKTGRKVTLSNTIDFRRRTDEPPTEFPASTGNLGVTYTSYLPRRDKVVLYGNGRLGIIQGIPSLDPKYPTTSSQEFVLFLLDIPGYLYNLSDIKITKIQNRLHTQQEIGKIQNRIKNLEEISSLSSAESLAQNINITNDEGEDRFKTSILVDSFNRSHSIGDVQNSDYTCSVDPEEKVLRPAFSSDAWKFDIESTSSTSRTGDLVTLSYTPEIFIDQPFSSGTVNLNSANKTVFDGQLILGSSGDIWYDKSSTVRPFVGKNTKGKNDGWKEISTDKVYGSHYGDWSTNWSGSENSEKYNNENISRGIHSGVYDEEAISFGEDDLHINGKYVDKSVQPYIRSQEIVFVAKGLRTKTLHTLQFDDQTITPNTGRFGVRCTISGLSGSFIARDGEFETVSIGSNIIGQVVSVSATSLVIIPNLGSTVTSGVVTGSTSGATATIGTIVTSTSLTSDDFGEIAGAFTIPQGHTLTGSRIVRLTDNTTVSSSTSIAENIFNAKGILDVKNSTRELEKTRKSIQDSRLEYMTNSSTLLNSLSQIFEVSSSENPNGIFLQNLHLFFSSKDISTTFGSHISIELRPVLGESVSESKVIPYSKVSLHSTSINVVPSGSTITIPTAEGTASNSTIFEFNAPVFLSPGSYALVVKSNSSDFAVHLADVGGTMIGSTETINKASHIGNLQLPHNIGGNKNQKMLMFRLNRCEFSSTGSAVQINQLTSLGGLTSSSPDTVKLVGEELNVSGTTLSHTFTSNLDTSDTSIGKGIDYNFTSPRTINSSNRFRVTSSLSTSDTKVSPVIDISRSGLYAVSNLVDNAGLKSTNFAVTTGGSTGTRVFEIQTAEGDLGSGASVSPISDATGNLIGLSISAAGSGYLKSPSIVVKQDSSPSAPVVTDRVVQAISEDSIAGGNVLGKYITKRVTLEEGFSSKDLRVFVNANLPGETDINIYYKVLSDEDTGSFDDKDYYLMTQKKREVLDSNGNTRLVFGSENDNIIYESNGHIYKDFRHYAIKVVMTSTTTSYVPKVKDIAIVSVI